MQHVNLFQVCILMLTGFEHLNGAASLPTLPDNLNSSPRRYSREIKANARASTEMPLLEITTFTSADTCRLPEFPFHGKYSTLNNGGYVAGTYVNQYSVLMVKCNKGFIANVEGSVCIDGVWLPQPPQCIRACPPLYSTSTTKLKCKLNGKDLENCDKPLEGTTAEITCTDYYESAGPLSKPIVHCSRGSWDYSITNYCQPKCGQKQTQDSKAVNHPWQVSIYDDKQYKCGGAILSPRVVISAAHCFTDISNGNLLPRQNFMVAVGKHYRPYTHPNDTISQHSEISHIELPERYRGVVNQFEADIALLILSTPLYLSETVLPVCLDLPNDFEYEQLKLGHKGIVSAWRQTVEGSNSSETLKEIEIPYVPYLQCYDQVSKDFRPYIRHDKICGGCLEEGKTVHHEDAGGALSFENKGDDRFYIRGIVSVCPINEAGQCDSSQYSTFTLVSTYMSLIRRVLHEYR